jgi:hypothetical protein
MNMKGVFFNLTGIFLILALQTGCSGESNHKKGRSRRAVPERNLTIATQVLNSKCPEMIDPETRLDSIILTDEDHLSYYYTLINKDNGTFDEMAFQAYLIPKILTIVHGSAGLKMHRDSSVIMDFNYRDRNGITITEFSVTPEMYQ